MRCPYTSAMSTQPPHYASVRQSVVVTGIEMSVGDLCRFLIKAMIAAIPVVLVCALVMMLVGFAAVKYFGGVGVILHDLVDIARGR